MKKDTTYTFIRDPVTGEYTLSSKKYAQVCEDIKELKSTRESILNRHFYELYHYNIDDLEDRDGRIMRILGKSITYPNAFLASTLGFTRTSWMKKYEEILLKFDLAKKPKYQTLRNMVLFEKLKLLIIKYYDVKKKDKQALY